MSVVNASSHAISGVRHIAFRLCAVLFALFYAMLLSGLNGLPGNGGIGWGDQIHRVHHVAGTLFIGIIVVGLLAQLRAPERNVAAFQQVVMGLLANPDHQFHHGES